MPAPENTTYIIQHKTTKEKYKASSGKSSWRKPQHAKAAFLQSHSQWNDKYYIDKYKNTGKDSSWYYERPVLKFDEQEVQAPEDYSLVVCVN